jgi:hypothetical protein
MFEISVTVQGPGGTFDFELEVIRRALEKAGCNVEISTNNKLKPMSDEAFKKMMDTSRQRKDTTIKLHAHHLPWGG